MAAKDLAALEVEVLAHHPQPQQCSCRLSNHRWGYRHSSRNTCWCTAHPERRRRHRILESFDKLCSILLRYNLPHFRRRWPDSHRHAWSKLPKGWELEASEAWVLEAWVSEAWVLEVSEGLAVLAQANLCRQHLLRASLPGSRTICQLLEHEAHRIASRCCHWSHTWYRSGGKKIRQVWFACIHPTHQESSARRTHPQNLNLWWW